jgi:hypothetical protein|uniref:Uncharacterized protein n=1 Tax=viral metagenome TaxID=1070528 RepID=A0A6C0JAI8_9ZZZZ
MDTISFITQYKLQTAILLYIIILGILVASQPGFLFNRDGTVKQFGLGSQSKTVIPLWFIIIGTGILSYISIMYLSRMSKLNM